MAEWLIDAAAVITAGTTAFYLCLKLHRAVCFIEAMERHLRENHLSILRLTITSPEMPLSERIAAGDEYIREGGNGAVRCLYEALLEENGGKQHEGITH